MTTLEELLTSETSDESKASLLEQLSDADFPVTDWEEGGVARTFVELDAQVNSDFSSRQVEIAKCGFLTLATGGWKTLVASEFYGLTRYSATRTVGPQRLYCTSEAGPYTVLANQLWVTDADGRRYNNTTAGTLPQGTTIAAGSDEDPLPAATIYVASTVGFPTSGTLYIGIDGEIVEVTYTNATSTTFTGCSGGTGTLATGQTVYGTLDLTVQAESAGTDYNVLPNTITTMATVLPGVTTTNPGTGSWPTTPGTDEETDAQLEQRCTTQWATLGYGQNADWFTYWSRTGHDYADSVTRVRVDTDTTGGGTVTVTIAGSTGTLGGTVVDTVDTWLTTKLATTTKLVVQAAGEESLDLSTLTVWVKAANYDAYQDAAETALNSLLAALDIGDTCYLSAQIEALMAPEGAINVVITGGADVEPADTDVVVLGTFTPTVVSV